MKVITLNKNNFEEACGVLSDKLFQSGDITALVGVRTGGAIVATIIYDNLKERSDKIEYFEVGASRYGTVAKNSNNTRAIFNFFPLNILDILRIIEHYFVRLRVKLFKKVERSIVFDKNLVEYLKGLTVGRVFVIDDAIDSGATVKSIVDKCYLINPLLEYKVAVLVVTQNKPIMLPDICLYRSVLLRFPWSNDFKA